MLVLAVTAVALLLSGTAAGAGCRSSGAGCGASEPVPSLEPQATAAEWTALVRARPGAVQTLARADCRPVRAVFYAQTDWLRLATKLAAAQSPCGQYAVSIPPLTSDKTKPRPDQAWRVRALGPNFHALAEIHLATWRSWVAANGSTWYAAGVEARRRMAAAGYDVAQGDGWALNELSSAVRRGQGTARADTREFVRGLHDGDGTLPPVRGTVFVVGIGQSSPDLATYKAKLQTWLEDAAFWGDMSAYVSDWAQEVYADVRAYAAEGAPAAARRDALNEYLQHQLRLATVGPDSVGAARAYLQGAYVPLGNAAWQWLTKYGWTAVGADEMKDFVSAQTYAMRGAAAANPAGDRLGFAWAPRNLSEQPKGVFAAQAGQLLERLGEAIRDSAEWPTSDPGSAACGPAGQNLWCNRAIPGAAITDRWRSFSAWTSISLGFSAPLQTLAAGAVSRPLAVQLQIGRIPTPSLQPVPVTLASSSPAGAFALVPEGPWTPTLTLPLDVGATATPTFLYRDTRAGSAIVTASAAGVLTAAQTVTILPGDPVSLSVTPPAATLRPGETQVLSASGVDVYGNAAALQRVAWSVSPPAVGRVSPATGPSTTFVASASSSGAATVEAVLVTAGAQLVARARVEVQLPPTMRVASVRQRPVQQGLRVTTRVVDAAGRGVERAIVLLTVYRDGKGVAALRGRTAARGLLTVVPGLRASGCYSTHIRNVAKPGKKWQRGTPANRVCRR